MIPTNEELMIARHTQRQLRTPKSWDRLTSRLQELMIRARRCRCKLLETKDHDHRMSPPFLKGTKALVVGVANQFSIAYRCAKAFRELGAELALTYVNEKTKTYVEPLAQRTGRTDLHAARCRHAGSSRSGLRRITKEWGQLDILVHSIAWAPKQDLQGLHRLLGRGLQAGDGHLVPLSVRMARLAAPLMKSGGSMFAMSYHGANEVMPNYNVMGPVKAALEAWCHYVAFELGSKGIRVHAISPGPLKTRAASSLNFDLLLTDAAQRAPIGELVDIMDVGFTCDSLPRPTRGGCPVQRSTSTAA